MFIYALSIFLTSTAFVSTNAKYGIPLSRYTVFLKTVLWGPPLNNRAFYYYLLLVVFVIILVFLVILNWAFDKYSSAI